MVWFVLGFFCAAVFSTNVAFAKGTDIGQVEITPASPFYFLKALSESLQLRFTKTPEDIDLIRLKFITRRIAEVKSLVGTPREDLIEPTLEKYWSEFQQLRSKANLKDWETAKQVSYGVIAQMDSLQKVFTQVSDPRAKRSIRLAINRISEWEGAFMSQVKLFGQIAFTEDITNSKLSACKFLSQEASSSALNEVEREVFVTRAKRCSQSAI